MKSQLGIARLACLMRVAARHLFEHYVNRLLRRWPKLAERLAGPQVPGPMRLRIAIEEMGGTFIKFGQMLALQSDLLPLEYCRELYKLLDNVPAFELEHVKKTFREELGREPDDIFDKFDPKPVATGSIGQVHVAVLRGRRVAVKVRRPTVLTDFGLDMRLMTGVVSFIRLCHIKSLYWMIEPASEFVAWTREELDYRCEARYMEELGGHSRNSSSEFVPAVFREYTTRRILTVEFLDALTVLEYLRARETGDEKALYRLQLSDFDPDVYARNIVDNFLGDAFQHGLFHADLHPANLMILPSNRVGYIDFGIAGSLSPYSRQHLLAMTLAYSRGDLPAMCEAFFRISTVDSESDVEGFRHGLEQLAQEWYGLARDEARFRKSITVIMLELLTLSRRCAIWPQRDVIKYIRSAIAIDGLIKQFAPGFDIGRHLEAACDRHLHWGGLRELVSAETMTAWLRANISLTRNGALRVIEGMRRFAKGDFLVHADIEPRRIQVSTSTAQSIRVLIVTLMLSILFSLDGEGLRLMTSSLDIVALAAMVLALYLGTARRSTRGY
jgi:ubiquinone biosynthesis protein